MPKYNVGDVVEFPASRNRWEIIEVQHNAYRVRCDYVHNFNNPNRVGDLFTYSLGHLELSTGLYSRPAPVVNDPPKATPEDIKAICVYLKALSAQFTTMYETSKDLTHLYESVKLDELVKKLC